MKEYYLKLKRLSDNKELVSRSLLPSHIAKEIHVGLVRDGCEVLEFYEIGSLGSKDFI